MHAKALWRTIGLSSLAATLVLLFGFGYAVNDLLNPQTRPPEAVPESAAERDASPPVKQEGYRIVAIGDSLTQGIGDESGEGYVKRTASLLQKKTGQPAEILNNLGVSGLQADELAQRLTEDKAYAMALSRANLILFTIGGNDLFQFAQTQPGRADASAGIADGDTSPEGATEPGTAPRVTLDPRQAEQQLQEGIGRLRIVIDRLYEINPNAAVVYIGLYNPFYDIPELRQGSLAVQDWNREAYRLLQQYPNMSLVPSADLFERAIGSRLSQDHFHPNGDGYAAIAERIVQTLE
ncbi:GDSL-type esterase/lipase family protein [Paenibacillus darwinianus]|nr:GDSL-type esterase/lipase family protein [Paenibacillus darwinianus]